MFSGHLRQKAALQTFVDRRAVFFLLQGRCHSANGWPLVRPPTYLYGLPHGLRWRKESRRKPLACWSRTGLSKEMSIITAAQVGAGCPWRACSLAGDQIP